MPDLNFEYLTISSLTPRRNNARRHSKKQVRQIADSLTEFGVITAVLIDEDNVIIAGHGRVEAAKFLGLERLPCIRATHLTEAQKRAYVIADNKLAENATWDMDLLQVELSELASLDLTFDLEVVGFDTPDLDILIDGSDPTKTTEPRTEQLPSPETVKKRCQLGDIWQLGKHRLYCGDARDRMSLRLLMAGEKADMICVDPPFNVRVNGHVSGSGQHPEFAMASGEMTSQDFTQFLKESFETLAHFSSDGSLHYIFMDWRHQREILDAADGVYSRLLNLIVWDKCAAGQGSHYRSAHELVFLFKKGTAPHTNNIELGRHGRNRSNIWRYKGLNTGGANRLEELSLHPTVKPTAMLADAILDATKRNGLVLDTFAGSGSTLIAAEMVGRRAYVAEISPHYCDIVLSRWEAFAHGEAELVRRISGDEEAVA